MNFSKLKWKLNVSYSLDKGGRNYMEDVIYSYFEKNNESVIFGFFGIFDGHGGVEAANFVKKTLKDELINIEKFWSNDNDDVLDAIKIAYSKVQKLIWIDRESWPRTISGYKSTAGTTATIVIIRNGILYTGHVGDSGVLLAYDNEDKVLVSKELTKEHKPEDPLERKRIEASGGSLKCNGSVVRVNWHRENINYDVREMNKIPFLAVARSLGDLWSYDAKTHQYHVSPEPDVRWIQLDFNVHRAVIIGSDGLWNVIKREKCVKLLNLCNFFKKDGYCINPAQLIVNYCLFQWEKKNLKADNVSVIVILLQPEQSISDEISTDYDNVKEELLELFNEIRSNNLFTNYLTEECEILLDNFPDASQFDRYSIQNQSIDEENLMLLKKYIQANNKLSMCCKNWYGINDYWPILLRGFMNIGFGTFPNIILYLDSLSDDYMTELLTGFPWSVCCLQLLDSVVSSSQIRNYIKLQPLLTEFWNNFYKIVINNSVICPDESLSTQSMVDNMRNILITKSVDLTNWIKSLISSTCDLSITNQDSLKFSMKKSLTLFHYNFIRDFFNEQNSNFVKDSTKQFNNCLKLKRSASYDTIKSQMFCNYNTNFESFNVNTPLLSPSNSQSKVSSDCENQISISTNYELPYVLKRQIPIDILSVPDSNDNNHTSNQYCSKKRRLKM